MTWYIGLGAGSQPAQIPLEKAFAEKFNKSQDKIQLIPIIVDNKYARDNLTAQLAAGNAPDIVGPVGTAGRAAFPGQFADLESLMKKANYDPGDIDQAFLDFYKVEGKLEGLPFAIFPSATFVNKDLFKEAGLALPPQKVGDKYVLDGKEVEWNFDTVAQVARKLTVDKNGNDATSPNFDEKNIVQWGFNSQWNDEPGASLLSRYFCAGYPVGADGKAVIPDCWKEAAKWYYDGYFGKQPFIPNQAAIASDLLKGNEFSSGKLAMGLTHLWYTCCVDPRTCRTGTWRLCRRTMARPRPRCTAIPSPSWRSPRTPMPPSKFTSICWVRARRTCIRFTVVCPRARASRLTSSTAWTRSLRPTRSTGKSFRT